MFTFLKPHHSAFAIKMTTENTLKSGSGLSRVCRLCFTNDGKLYRIFGGGIKDLAAKINDITALELEDMDSIPSMICELCRSQVLVSHQFVLQCRISDWKYKKQLIGARPIWKGSKGQRLSTDSSSSGIGELTWDDAGPSSKVPTRPVAAIPLKSDGLRRLKNDDRASRRHSIDLIRKFEAKKPPKRRFSESSQHNNKKVKVKRDEDRDSRKKQCPTCGNYVVHLRDHIVNMHTDVPKLVCPVCAREFKHKQWFTCHVNNHNGIHPYKCGLCDKSYSYPSSLADHMKSHQERYYCIVCNAGFTHVKIMREHMVFHNKYKQ